MSAISTRNWNILSWKDNATKILIITFLLLGNSFLQAQIEVASGATPPYNPQTLIEDVLLGQGVEILNIQYEGEDEAVGYFNKGLNDIGIEEGIVLTTGVATTSGANIGIVESGSIEASANNNSTATDPDIEFLAENESIFNLAKFTITFVPSSDQMSFKYVFASDEYPEFGCTPYNDFFGFFISGPGFSGIYENGAENIALIPGTNLPVSINNIHPQNPLNSACTPEFEEFFNDNDGQASFPVYDGFLDVFTATATVVPCETYTIKLVIADISDAQRDSGVFFEARSFNSNGFEVSANSQSLDGTLVEGCTDGSFDIAIAEPAATDIILDYQMIGDAVNGLDYENIIGDIVIPAGETSVSIPIIPIADTNIEGVESIGFDIQINNCTRDTFYLYLRDSELETPDLGDDVEICAGESVTLDGSISATPTTTQTFNSTSAPVVILGPIGSIPPSPTYMDIDVSGINPPELIDGLIESVCMNITHSADEDLDIYLYSPGGQFIPLTSDNGEGGDHYTNTCFSPTATDDITFGMQFAPASATPFTGTFQPEGDWNNLYFGDSPANGTWRLMAIDDNQGFTGALQDWSITFNQIYDIAYSWLPIDGLSCTDCPNPIATPNSTTTYTLTITDTYGCQTSDDITVTVIEGYDAPTINCTDVSTNSITFEWNMIDFTTGYEVSVEGMPWETPNNGLNSHIIDDLAPGEMITIEVRATGPCSAMIGSATCTAIDCTTFTINASSDQPSCVGGNDGSITLVSDGDNLPHNYILNGDTTLVAEWSDLSEGIYTVTIFDAVGCSEIFPIPVTDPTPVTSNVTLNNNVDCDNSIASATAEGMGGLPVFSYLWTNGQVTPTMTTADLGWHFVTITDGRMCETIDSIQIISEGMLEVTASANTICPNTNLGEATVTIISGLEPITYIWDANASNQETAIATNLIAGEYFVTVTSADNCQQIVSATVNSFPETLLDISSMDANCGSSDGTATVTVTNPIGDYTYTWSDDATQNTATATELAAGEYFVTVTDENNCETVINTTINTPSSIVLDNLSTTDATCNGEENGIVTLVASGGTAPLSFTLNTLPIQDNGSFSDLAAADYSMIVTDAMGCSTSFDFTINEPPAIVSTENIMTEISCTSPNGTATFDIEGGLAPYTFVWSNMQTDPILSTTTAGEYYVTITDASNCAIFDTLAITQNALLSAEISSTPTCAGVNEGTATVSIITGTEPIVYAWDNNAGNQNTPTAIGLAVGDYTVTVTDALDCEEILMVSVIGNSSMTLSMSSTDADCNGAPDGTATVTVMGGTPMFTYLWNNNQTTATAIDLSAGQYTVTVTDMNGCTATETVNVLTPSQLAIDALTSTPVTCFDGDDGTATVVASGGTGSFTYSWSSATQTTSTITGLTPGEYTVSVSDEEGCEVSGSVNVENAAPIIVTSTQVNVLCANDDNGSIDLSISGGTLPYSYNWSTLEITEDIDNLSAGNYSYTISDANNCEEIGMVTINTTAPINVLLDASAVSCYNQNDGTITTEVNGGQEPYTYVWSTGATTPNLENAGAGIYDVIVTDANNCGVFETIEIIEPNAFEGFAEIVEPLCAGDSNGSLTLTAVGGNPNFSYSIDGINYQEEPIFEGLNSQNYEISIQDANGCFFEDDIYLTEPFALNVSVGDDLKTILGERIFVEALISGGTGDITFEWTSAESIDLSCLDCFNPYALVNNYGEVSVLATDENGCTAEDALFIDVDKTHKLYVPNVFSPDNDGINDIFMPYSRPETFVESFLIFDRWGNKIYENGQFFTLDVEGWDGKHKNQFVETGVYVWVIEASFIDGENVLFKGDVTVIR